MIRSGILLGTLALLLPGQEARAESSSATVAGISIERLNVFDPSVTGEDWWPFRMANLIHIKTRKSVVLHEVLISPGSRFDDLKAIETERNLRSLGFIRHAELRPIPRPDGKLDLRVRTQDSWTLMPQFGVGTEGGDNFFIAGIREGNLLGYGKEISYFHSEVGPTVRNELRYSDPRVWNSWYGLLTHFADTSRGSEVGVRLSNPFVSFASRWASDVSWAKINEEQELFQSAETTSKFDLDFRAVRSLGAVRVGRSRRFVQRVQAGTLFERYRFGAKTETAAGTLPSDRTLSGPLVGYSWIQPKYLKETEINSMQRVEDFNLGNEFMIDAGPMLKSWGSDRDRWIGSALMQQGLRLAPGRFILAQAGVQGRLAGRVVENAIFFSNLNLVWKTEWPFRQTFVSHLEWNTTRRLDGEKQLALGGSAGLRGYKNDSFTGDKVVLLNFEDRVFHDRDFFHLLYLGGVVFFDAGIVQAKGARLSLRQFKSDVGFGLRFSPSR
ncbi:MAG: hypothetical protein V3S11_01655, partial [Elusimicrobiota bacterium]